MGFIAFSVLSSVVYIINDLKDMEKDKCHSKKCKRPLAAGTVSPQNAIRLIIVLLIVLIGIVCSMGFSYNIFYAVGVLSTYLLINIAYSFGAKNIPIIDVIILAGGYILRVLFGGILLGINISFWLYLVITFCAFYLGFGKRRNEIVREKTDIRSVLKVYSYNFLDKSMYVCQTLCIVFYSFWSIDLTTIQRLHTNAFVFTVPIVFLIFLKYNLNIEGDSDGEPTMVLLQDKMLFALVVLYIAVSIVIICFDGVL
jgi:4-hydroxybenzoate polyprenyltransferase